MTSTLIASHIIGSVKVNPAYSVKKVQADIKDLLNFDVSYKQAWYGKKTGMDG